MDCLCESVNRFLLCTSRRLVSRPWDLLRLTAVPMATLKRHFTGVRMVCECCDGGQHAELHCWLPAVVEGHKNTCFIPAPKSSSAIGPSAISCTEVEVNEILMGFIFYCISHCILEALIALLVRVSQKILILLHSYCLCAHPKSSQRNVWFLGLPSNIDLF